MKKAFLILLISVCLITITPIKTFASISLVIDSFEVFNYQRNIVGDDNFLIVGTNSGATYNGGYSVSTFAVATSYAAGYTLWPPSWWDYSNVEAWYNWRLQGHLEGDPTNTAEIIMDYRLWTFPLLKAFPASTKFGFGPTANTATAVTQWSLSAMGVSTDGYFQEYATPFYDIQSHVWLSIGGYPVTEEGSISFGTFTPDSSDYFEVNGSLYIRSESYANPVGYADSNVFSNMNITLTAKMLGEDEEIPPSRVPEPSTLLLMGIGFLPFLRKKFTIYS